MNYKLKQDYKTVKNSYLKGVIKTEKRWKELFRIDSCDAYPAWFMQVKHVERQYSLGEMIEFGQFTFDLCRFGGVCSHVVTMLMLKDWNETQRG